MERGTTPISKPHAARIGRILSKLDQVRARHLSCFGSDTHKFKLSAPLSAAAIQQFEQEHHITLPEDYAAFLQLAGNGGAGPYYGLYPLAEWNDFLDWVSDGVPEVILAKPCPLHPDMPAVNDWDAPFSDCVSPYQGTIAIGTQGCTYMMGLIVTGDYKGRVVYLDADNHTPYVVHEPDFLSWYERWLDELLAGCESFWFGYGLGGDERRLWEIFDDQDSVESHRALAIHGMCKWPNLSAAGRLRVGEIIAHPSADVRTAACQLVGKFAIRELTKHLVVRVQDESAEVRQAAIRALSDLQPVASAAECQVLLFDENQEVANTAYFSLKRNAPLSRELLLLLLKSPHASIRGFAAHDLHWHQEDLPLLIGLLADDSFNLRSSVIFALRKLKDPACLPVAIALLERGPDPIHVDFLLELLGIVRGPQNAEILLTWAQHPDDLHRLAAFDSLCKLGDERARSIAVELLAETRQPRRVSGSGWTGNVQSIGTLARKSLQSSPNAELRSLVESTGWLGWLKPW
jgi:HEAT repeat protein